MTTKKRSHKNNLRRLTAREWARAFFAHPRYAIDNGEDILTEMFEAHARQTLARHKRKHRPRTPIDLGKLARDLEPTMRKTWGSGK